MKNEYIIPAYNGKEVRLTRGMTKAEVVSRLGEPYRTEHCKKVGNEKLIFKIDNRILRASNYTVLFIDGELFYVAKLN